MYKRRAQGKKLRSQPTLQVMAANGTVAPFALDKLSKKPHSRDNFDRSSIDEELHGLHNQHGSAVQSVEWRSAPKEHGAQLLSRSLRPQHQLPRGFRSTSPIIKRSVAEQIRMPSQAPLFEHDRTDRIPKHHEAVPPPRPPHRSSSPSHGPEIVLLKSAQGVNPSKRALERSGSVTVLSKRERVPKWLIHATDTRRAPYGVSPGADWCPPSPSAYDNLMDRSKNAFSSLEPRGHVRMEVQVDRKQRERVDNVRVARNKAVTINASDERDHTTEKQPLKWTTRFIDTHPELVLTDAPIFSTDVEIPEQWQVTPSEGDHVEGLADTTLSRYRERQSEPFTKQGGRDKLPIHAIRNMPFGFDVNHGRDRRPDEYVVPHRARKHPERKPRPTIRGKSPALQPSSAMHSYDSYIRKDLIDSAFDDISDPLTQCELSRRDRVRQKIRSFDNQLGRTQREKLESHGRTICHEPPAPSRTSLSEYQQRMYMKCVQPILQRMSKLEEYENDSKMGFTEVTLPSDLAGDPIMKDILASKRERARHSAGIGTGSGDGCGGDNHLQAWSMQTSQVDRLPPVVPTASSPVRSVDTRLGSHGSLQKYNTLVSKLEELCEPTPRVNPIFGDMEKLS